MSNRLSKKQDRRPNWFKTKNEKKVAKEKKIKKQEAHEKLLQTHAENKKRKLFNEV